MQRAVRSGIMEITTEIPTGVSYILFGYSVFYYDFTVDLVI